MLVERRPTGLRFLVQADVIGDEEWSRASGRQPRTLGFVNRYAKHVADE
jgi:hypothetical protein